MLDFVCECEVLWWMGMVGINIGDDVVLVEVMLWLDSLFYVYYDVVVVVVVGFLWVCYLFELGG